MLEEAQALAAKGDMTRPATPFDALWLMLPGDGQAGLEALLCVSKSRAGVMQLLTAI